MSEKGSKPVSSLSKYALFLHSVFFSPLLYFILCSAYRPYFFLALILPLFLSSPLSSLTRPSLSVASPPPALIPTLLSIPTLAFKSQTPEPKAYFTGSGFPLLIQLLVLGAGVTDTSHPNLQLMKGGKKQQIGTIMKEPTFIPLWVSGFDK